MSVEGNLKIVQQAYADFARGNIPGLLGALAPDIEWREPPGGPVPFAGVYRGREAVAEFFRALDETASVESFEPREFFAQGETVIVTGWYRFRVKATGRAYETDWVMVWRFRGGQVEQFQIHKDSSTEREALKSE
jgi:hypothetical protein